MVAHTASDSPGFVPVETPRLAVASDGTLAAIAEPRRIVVLEIPGEQPFAEIGIDPHAVASDMAWVGAPPRLVIVSRFSSHSTAHLIDPYGPRTISELRFESPIKLLATVGSSALVVGAMGAAVLTAGDANLTPYQFPARGVPSTAGAAGSNLVVALTGSIEEWDPQSRMPKRRLRLPRPAVITALGGSDRVVWMTTQQEPARIDVIALINRGQPKHHDLPEPIVAVSGHPRSDVIVCLGRDSGRVYVIDLDGRSGMRVIGPEGIDRTEAAALVVGRVMGVLAAQAQRQLALVTLDGREIERARPRSAGSAPGVVAAPAPLMHTSTGSTLGGGDVGVGEQARRSSLFDDDDDDDLAPSAAPATAGSTAAAAAPGRSPAVISPAAISAAAIAPPVMAPRSSAPPISSTSAVVPPAPASSSHVGLPPAPVRAPGAPLLGATAGSAPVLTSFDPRSLTSRTLTWRDRVVAWAVRVTSGADGRDPPSAPPLEELAARFELGPELLPAAVLLYGAHLGGIRGVAPVDLARVLDGRWDEALGSGELAATGLAIYVDSRVQLAPAVRRALDELPVATGTIVGHAGPIALLGPCVVVATVDEPLAAVAARHVGAVGGAILAANDDVDPAELFSEARARGAAPMVRVARDEILELGTDPAILVVEDDAIADELGVPRLS